MLRIASLARRAVPVAAPAVSRAAIVSGPAHRARAGCLRAWQRRTPTQQAGARALSSAAAADAAPRKDAAASSGGNLYSHTMLLPRTTFPQFVRGVHEHERSLSARYCGSSNLYQWQSRARSHHPRSATFLLHDGPPFANGRLHMGHFLNKVLKDFCNRYKLMRGYRLKYRPGWDCHGMPIEVKALEQLKAQQSGEAKGNAAAVTGAALDASVQLSPSEIRSLAARFARGAMEEQKGEFQRWGILGSWDTPYYTMDPAYEAAQMGVFATLVQRGLVYRGLKPVYWSPVSRTALAEAELEYVDDHVSTSLYVSFPFSSFGSEGAQAGLTLDKFPGLSALIWTTTPWTLPSNLAISFHPELEYAVVRVGGKDAGAAGKAATEAAAAAPAPVKGQPKAKNTTEEGASVEGSLWLVGVDRLAALESLLHRPLEVLHRVRGSALSGSSTQHPFLPRPSPLIPGSHVTTDGGTALVHTAPAHGMEDFTACKAAGITEVLCPVDAGGTYTAEVGLPELVGQNVLKGASKHVVGLLRTNGTLVHTTRLVHRYPYDWRSKTPVIQRATEQWFCKLDALAPAAMEALGDVQLIPPQGAARLQGMIAGRKEWCISRQRHWGVPIPVFFHRESGEPLLTPESVAHVQKLVSVHGTDCWWSLPLSELLPPSHAAKAEEYERGADTMDVWFDSGCSWRAVVQAPESEGQTTHSDMVADMYLEGSDQHRGWFQSSLLTSVAATDRAPYKTILTRTKAKQGSTHADGFVLDEHSRKMSKSLGNVLDPSTLINGQPTPSIEDAPAAPSSAAAAASTDAAPAAAAAAAAAAGGKKKPPKGKKVPAPGDPLGVDLLRLWVASSDFGGDITVGKAVLTKMGEALKKLRPSARFMLGCIDDLTPESVVPFHKLGQVDRYTLGLVSSYAAEVTESFERWDFKSVVAASLSFNAGTLSAFAFELAKDRLYAELPDSPARRAAQTVLLHALVVVTKALAPLVPHFAEEVYQHVPQALKPFFHEESANGNAATPVAADADASPNSYADSLFMHGWLGESLGSCWSDSSLSARVSTARRVRSHVSKLLERVRQEEKLIGNFSEAQVHISVQEGTQMDRDLREMGEELTPLLGTASCTLVPSPTPLSVESDATDNSHLMRVSELASDGTPSVLLLRFSPADGSKCPRCWLFTREATEEQPCCTRCRQVMQAHAQRTAQPATAH